MVTHVLLAFKGAFADLIYKGIKKYEVRKSNMTLITLKRSLAFIYEVKPVGKVTGQFLIENLTFYPFPQLAIRYLDLDVETRRYIANLDTHKKIYVLTISKCIKFEKAVKITNIPRSWRYIQAAECSDWR